jgi:anti-anti-sigma factor
VEQESILVLEERLAGRNTDKLNDEIEELLLAGVTQIVCDASQTTFMDSTTIGVLVNTMLRLQERGGKLRVKNLHDVPLNVFQRSGLDMVFTLIQDEEERPARMQLFKEVVDLKLKLEYESRGTIGIFRFSGVLDFPDGARLFKQKALLALKNNTKLLLDFDHLTYLQSLTVAEIISIYTVLEVSGGEMRICSVNEIIKDVIQDLNISRIIPLYINEEAALWNWQP